MHGTCGKYCDQSSRWSLLKCTSKRSIWWQPEQKPQIPGNFFSILQDIPFASRNIPLQENGTGFLLKVPNFPGALLPMILAAKEAMIPGITPWVSPLRIPILLPTGVSQTGESIIPQMTNGLHWVLSKIRKELLSFTMAHTTYTLIREMGAAFQAVTTISRKRMSSFMMDML